jgi:hypothetical protein
MCKCYISKIILEIRDGDYLQFTNSPRWGALITSPDSVRVIVVLSQLLKFTVVHPFAKWAAVDPV